MNIQTLSKYLTMAAFAGAMTCGTLLYAQQDSSTPPQSAPPSQAQPDNQQAPGAYGQATPGSQSQQAPGSQSGQMGAGAQSGMGAGSTATSDPAGGQMIVGTVVKNGDKYQLKDDSSGQVYDIDHQSDVSKFEGKRVRVRGVVDPATKTIHLQ